MLKYWIFLALGFFFSSANAGEWKVSPADDLKIPSEGKIAPDGLPDGHVAWVVFPEPLSAWYATPTKRYAHGILGDAVEAASLVVKTNSGKTLTYTLPDDQVFEDRTPRIVDLAGIGSPVIVTILSHKKEGASLAVFGVVEEQIQLLAQTPYIGLSNRWRNIAGFADFDGDGSMQIAEVVTPHIGGTLKFWTWKKGELVPSGEMYGFSNHFIGSREQRLSTVEDFDGDGVSDLALPSADRKSLRLIKFSGKANGEKTLEEIASIPLPARIDKAITSNFDGEKVVITVGLEDGSVWAVHQ